MKGKPSGKTRSKRTRKMKGGSHGHTYIFFHIYCNQSTVNIVGDQVTKIIFSGLYKDVDKIYCFLAGSAAAIHEVKTFIATLPSKFVVQAEGVDDGSYERFTLHKIADMLKDSDKFLYIHSKGVSRSHEKNKLSSVVYLWRNYLEYFMIAHYRDCLEKLKKFDVVGAAYKTERIGPHFSGNFWWCTGAYYKKLAKAHPTIGSDYLDPEAYLFKEGPTAYLVDGDMIKDNPMYAYELFPKLYMDKKVF